MIKKKTYEIHKSPETFFLALFAVAFRLQLRWSFHSQTNRNWYLFHKFSSFLRSVFKRFSVARAYQRTWVSLIFFLYRIKKVVENTPIGNFLIDVLKCYFNIAVKSWSKEKLAHANAVDILSWFCNQLFPVGEKLEPDGKLNKDERYFRRSVPNWQRIVAFWRKSIIYFPTIFRKFFDPFGF